MNMRINRGWAGMTVLALALGLQGCGGDEDTSSTASQIVVNTPAQIAQVSADNYDDNVNGLITESTLKRWKDNWTTTERAKLGLTGKLVILQVTQGPPGSEFIKPGDLPGGANVFVYGPKNQPVAPSVATLDETLSSEWVQTRSNGVVETQSMVPDGAAMDALLKKYNIDPRNDMVVVAMGTGDTGNAMAQGRIWYALRYWGMDKKNLAILNGGNQWLDEDLASVDVELLPATDFAATANTPPNNGTISVKSLLVDNTQLQATLDDMLKILPSADTNVKEDGVFIWDARSISQYSAGETSTANTITPVSLMSTFQNSGSRQGHPWGALQLDFSNMLVSTEGYRYKDKAELQAYMDGNAPSGVGFINGSYQHVGVGNAYQPGDVIYTYCETTFRAMITGIASTVILGKPTRFYDGAMTEWNSLTPGSVITDKNGDAILPENSPWRTDVKSFFRAADSYLKVAPRVITNAYADNANAIVNADKAYKTGEAATSGGSSGGAPTNPCGG